MGRAPLGCGEQGDGGEAKGGDGDREEGVNRGLGGHQRRSWVGGGPELLAPLGGEKM